MSWRASFDLGLVNYLDGDDLPPDLETTLLLTGRPVVCMRPDSPLAGRDAIRISDLLAEPLIVMRSGYVMHRYMHRLLHGQAPAFSYSTDGAEMGKLMVAEGLGVTVLPDFSVIGDPLEQRKVITWRPLADDDTEVQLVIQRARSGVTAAGRAGPARHLRGPGAELPGGRAAPGTQVADRVGRVANSRMISGRVPIALGPWPRTDSAAAIDASRMASGTGRPRNISTASAAAKQSPAPVASTTGLAGSAAYSDQPSLVSASQPRRPRVTTDSPPWPATPASNWPR